MAGLWCPMSLQETLKHSQTSLAPSLMGSLLLSPGSWCAQGSICALQESVSLVLCKFWWLSGELMVTSSKRAYAIARSIALRAPAPTAGDCRLVPSEETLKHSSGSVYAGFLGPGAHKLCLSPLSIFGEDMSL